MFRSGHNSDSAFTSNRDTDSCRPDRDRRNITGWVYAGAILVGIWVLAPLVTRFISLAVGDTVTLTLSRPDEISGPHGAEILGLAAQIPVDQLGSGARTAVIGGTALQLVAVLTMLIAVTVVMRSVRPGGELTNATKISSISAVMIAGLIGLIGAHVLTSAGTLACADLYAACSAGRTWDDPLANAFVLAGIGLALVFTLVRSETVARRSAEGLI